MQQITTDLQEGKVLIQVDLYSNDRVAFRLRQLRKLHLFVKEVLHLLLGCAEWDVSCEVHLR